MRLLSRVVEGELYPNVAGVFALEVELLPEVALASPEFNDILKVDPSFADELCLLVVIEYRAFELIVVWRIVNGESELLIPACC